MKRSILAIGVFIVFSAFAFDAVAVADDKPRLMVQNDEVTDFVALSPNGQLMVSGNRKSSRIWEAATGRLLCIIDASLRGGTFSNDGHQFAVTRSAAKKKAIIEIWDMASCSPAKSVERDIGGYAVQNMSTLGDGRVLLDLQDAGSQIVDIFEIGGPLKTLRPHEQCAVESVVGHSADGRYLLESGEDYNTAQTRSALRLRDSQTGKLTTIRFAKSSGITQQSAAISDSGRWVAAFGHKSIQLYDRQTGKGTSGELSGHGMETAQANAMAQMLAFQEKLRGNECEEWKADEGKELQTAAKRSSFAKEEYQREYEYYCGSEKKKIAQCPADRSPVFDDDQPDLNLMRGWLRFSPKEDRLFVWRNSRDLKAAKGASSYFGLEERSLPDLKLIKTHHFDDAAVSESPPILHAMPANIAEANGMVLMNTDSYYAVLDLRQRKPRLDYWSPKLAGLQPRGSGIAWQNKEKIVMIGYQTMYGSASVPAARDHARERRQFRRMFTHNQMREEMSPRLIQWDVNTGEFSLHLLGEGEVFNPRVSHGGARLIYEQLLNADVFFSPKNEPMRMGVGVFDVNALKPLWHSNDNDALAKVWATRWPRQLTPDERYLLSLHPQDGECRKVEENNRTDPWILGVYDAETGRKISETTFNLTVPHNSGFKCEIDYRAAKLFVARDSSRIAVQGYREAVLFDFRKGRAAQSGRLSGNFSVHGLFPGSPLRIIGVVHDRLRDQGGIPNPEAIKALHNGKEIPFQIVAFKERQSAISPDGKTVAIAAGDKIELHDVENLKGKVVERFFHRAKGPVEGRTILAGHGAQILQLAYSNDGEYLVSYSTDGQLTLWDTKTYQWLARLYAFTNGTWAVVDPEGRFDTNNLERLEHLHWVVPDDPFRALPLEVFMRGYYTPRLLSRIVARDSFDPVENLAGLNRVQPRVKIAGFVKDKQDPLKVTVGVQVQNVSAKGQQSEVHDVRLFRNGRLVASQDGKIDVDPRTGKANLVFRSIALPTQGDGRVEFSAYAFNSDRVKSQTVRRNYEYEASSSVKSTAYVLSIGVNSYDNSAINLNYAANDAREIQNILVSRAKKTGQYTDVVGISLISDDGDQRNATKEKIRAALTVLAGGKDQAYAMSGVEGAERLKPASPDDVVMISFSGHGVAGDEGGFYLLPSDIGQNTKLELGNTLKERSISTADLANWLREIDAGDLSLIIDACHSAASIEQPGFKPGPMGSKGLGQLAYDKGVRILAASQAADEALEVDSLKHGLLTYALIKDGIVREKADHLPEDRRIDTAELLRYGVHRVPQIVHDLSGGARGLKGGGFTLSPANLSDLEKKQAKRQDKVQKPKLFDFSRTENAPYLVDLQ